MVKFLIDKSVKLLICNMTGTTINESGIVYKTMYNTIRGYDIFMKPEDIKEWYGVNKKEVLLHYINNDIEYRCNKEAIFPQMLNSFQESLKKSYFKDSNSNINLIDPKLPEHFNSLREQGIKIALNTSLSIDIQETLIEKLEMRDFIDGYISSESVSKGRPEPFMIQELMNRFDIKNPQEVIKVGDSINNILEGKNAGCFKSIGVLSGVENEMELKKVGADKILNNVMDFEIDN